MKRSLPLLLALLLCYSIGAHADPTVKLFDTDTSASPATRDWTFTLPPVPAGQQARLSFDARIDWPSLAGSNPWMRVLVNGHALTETDLLNKANDFKVHSGLDLTWVKDGKWRVLYSPDFATASTHSDDPMAVAGGQAYRYVWDITPYLKPGDNALRIVNIDVLFKPTELVLRNGAVEVGTPIKPVLGPDQIVTPPPTGPLQTYAEDGPHKLSLRMGFGPGEITIAGAGHPIKIFTRSSLPDGAWLDPATWQNLAAAERSEARIDGKVWGSGSYYQQKWQGRTYSIDRRVTFKDDHVEVSDTYTNLTNELIGIIVEHRLQYPSTPLHVFVSGLESSGQRIRDHNGMQPSVFAQWDEGGVGMVAEDDVFRAQVMNFQEPNAIGLADDKLGVEPGKPVTLEWSIYPVPADRYPNGDYWDFVNAVRRNWGVNFTIPGPFDFVGHFFGLKPTDPAAAYGDWIKARDLKVVSGDIAKFADGKYAHGTGILFAPEWIAKTTDWVAKIHQGAPGTKVLCYFHAQICTEPGAETKYAADREYNPDGTPFTYPYSYSLPGFLPTKGSVYGQALWGYLHCVTDTIGADGIYWDEMTHSVYEFADRAPWDGHTVKIDPTTHAVTGKTSSVPLLIQTLQLDFVNSLRAHGKYVMANTESITRTMMQQHIVRFVETGVYAKVANTNLACPLGLANHDPETSQAVAALHLRRILEHGGIYYGHTYEHAPAAWNFASVLYPITPERLGPGFVIGRERILTGISGRFAFADGAAADVYVVDAQGARVADPQVREIQPNGAHLYEIRMPSDNFAILVKRGQAADSGEAAFQPGAGLQTTP